MKIHRMTDRTYIIYPETMSDYLRLVKIAKRYNVRTKHQETFKTTEEECLNRYNVLIEDDIDKAMQTLSLSFISITYESSFSRSLFVQ